MSDQIRYRARWWTTREPMVFIKATNTTNAVAWRGHPAGTIMISNLRGRERGRMWEITAEFHARRDGWGKVFQDGDRIGVVEIYGRSHFADVVPRSAKLKLDQSIQPR